MQKSPIAPPDWDDLRYVLAVARSGSLAGAARALDVEHSTVFRRINAVEERIGAALFERSRSGYALTSHGEAVTRAAEVMEGALTGALRQITGADARPEGPVRLAASELLAVLVLPRLLPDLLHDLPGIRPELLVSNALVDLDRREADLAFRAQLTPPPHLVGRVVATIRYGVFASPSLLSDGPIDPLTLPWIGFDPSISHYPNARWMAERWPDARVRLRTDSTLSAREFALAGVGLAVLPLWAGTPEPGLVRLGPVSETVTMPLWLLRHADVAQNARVRALSAWLSSRVAPLQEAMIAEGAGRVRATVGDG